MQGELGGIDAALVDAPADEDRTILTDSLASIQKHILRQTYAYLIWSCQPARAPQRAGPDSSPMTGSAEPAAPEEVAD
jgi:hypothetical protein